MDWKEEMDNKAPLLTIVVPVYNVEKYLVECVESIIRQDYLMIEVLLIDDGSTDLSGKLCDEFAKKDIRIKSYHKQNGGLASARNFGIERANGDWIGFVDSDDWIYDDMFSEMMNCAIKENADIVCCNFDLQYENKMERRGKQGLECYRKDEAIINLFFPSYYQFFAPNKIFSKAIYKRMRFPDGKHFEDIPTTYKAFCLAEKVFFIEKSGYVYRQRDNSITRSEFNPKTEELLDAINYVYESEKRRCEMINPELTVGYIRYYLSFLDKAIRGNASKLNVYINNAKKLIKENKKAIWDSNRLSIARKLQFFLCAYFSKLYCYIRKIR